MRRLIHESIENPEEDLMLSKHIELEDEVAETGDYDRLKESADKIIAKDKETDSTEIAADTSNDTPSDTPGETVEASDTESFAVDNAEDKDGEETASGSPEDDSSSEFIESDGKLQTLASENLRAEYYDRLVLESFGYSDGGSGLLGTVASAAGSAISWTAGLIGRFTNSLLELGIQYYPGVLQFLKKTVVYLFSKTVQVTLKTVIAIQDFTTRHSRVIQAKRDELSKLQKELEELKTSSTGKLLTESAANPSLAKWFSVNGKVDPALSLTTLRQFTTTVVSQLNLRITNDVDVTNSLIELFGRGGNVPLHQFMKVDSLSGLMSVSTTHAASEYTDEYHYATILPNSTRFVAVLPEPKVIETADIVKAYHESAIFLMPAESSLNTENVNYMELDQLGEFMAGLIGLCDHALRHLEAYKAVSLKAGKLKLGYKNYYQKLVEDKGASSVQDTFAEYIYLKQSFVSRVYVPAAMDTQDYLNAYFLKAIQFVKLNLKNFEVTQSSVT